MTRALSRVSRRPRPEDWAEDAPMTLAEAVAVFADDYPMTISTLRTEIRNGRLTPACVAGKHHVTPAQIKALYKCPVTLKAPASISARAEPIKANSPSGSSVTERARSARAAALIAVERLSKGLPNTSPQSGRPSQPTPTASVIPLRS